MSELTGKQAATKIAEQTWRAVRECWAWRDAEEFIDLENLIDAIAAHLSVRFEEQDELLRYCARGGLAIFIKARAWLGGYVSAGDIDRALNDGVLDSDYSPNLQERYLVEREGREGYVRLAKLTDTERETVRRKIEAEADEAFKRRKALQNWAAHNQPRKRKPQ